MDTDLAEQFEKFRLDRARTRALEAFMKGILSRQETIVSALDDLNAAVQALTGEVQAAVAAIGNQGITAAEAETIVTDINNLAAEINGALNPPPAG